VLLLNECLFVVVVVVVVYFVMDSIRKLLDHSCHAIKTTHGPGQLEHRDPGFEFHSRHECMSATFCLLRPHDGPVSHTTSLTKFLRIHNLKIRSEL
jgi:hypothetical protein